MKVFAFVTGHILAATLLSILGFWLAKITGLPLLPAVVTLFISLPLMVTGILRLYWGSYAEIPPIAWIGLGTMLFAAVLFGLGMLLN